MITELILGFVNCLFTQIKGFTVVDHQLGKYLAWSVTLGHTRKDGIKHLNKMFCREQLDSLNP